MIWMKLTRGASLAPSKDSVSSPMAGTAIVRSADAIRAPQSPTQNRDKQDKVFLVSRAREFPVHINAVVSVVSDDFG